jgi:deoxyribodipyrimidine photolyase-related protein
MTNILLILFPSQLFESKYIKKIFSYTEDNIKIKSKYICLWEHSYFFTKFKYHKKKLILHRASMKKYYDSINSSEYGKFYLNANVNSNTDINKLNEYIKLNQIDQIRFFNPIEKELIQLIMTNKIIKQIEKIILPSPYFLNSTNFDKNKNINNELGGLKHNLFYKSQRIMYNIMVKKSGDKYIPEGSKWSYDTENRSPFEKSQQEPEILKFKSKKRLEYLEEAVKYVETNFSSHYGSSDLTNFIYPIDNEEAINWLKHFVSHKLDNFGKYEDALSSKIKFGFHSILSPLTNIGLITPMDIIEHIKEYKKNLASKEGFIRQVIGWREYCYFTYDLYGKFMESNSIYTLNKFSISKHIWNCSTQIPPIDNILKNVTSNAYSHHIERLMGIGNFLLLIETNPKEIYNWFQTMYIDAYDVFMVPNVYGMLCYAKLNENTHMMTRPYFASSNYIMKMSDYKSEITIRIGSSDYKWDDIMDSLYWYHIHKYSNVFKKIYATSSGVARWEKFDSDKKNQIIKLSKLYINWIHNK